MLGFGRVGRSPDGSAPRIKPPSRCDELDRLLDVGDQVGHIVWEEVPGFTVSLFDWSDCLILGDESE